MEFLLLWIDDIDDALGALRHLAPRIIGFLLAIALFASTACAIVIAPQVTLAIVALALSVVLFEFARHRLNRLLTARTTR